MEIIRPGEKIDSLIKENIPIFAWDEYLRAKSDEYGWFAENDFILPFIVQKTGFFKRLICATEVISQKPDSSIEEERKFLEEVVKFVRKMRVDFIDQPQLNAVFRTYPANSIYCEFGSYFVDLSKSEEELFKNLHVKHRNAIRKAQQQNVIILNGAEYLAVCHNLIRQTMTRHGKTYVSLWQLEKFRDNLQENILFYIAQKDGIAQSSAVVFWNSYSGYYLYGGSCGLPASGASNLLHWQLMLDLKKRGVRFYDFVGARIKPQLGSKQESLQRFKERFGSIMRKGYLWKYPIRNLNYNLYQKTKKLYFFLNGRNYSGDVIDEEQK